MLSYHISLGYNPTATVGDGTAWERLKEAWRSAVCGRLAPGLILAEVHRIGKPNCSGCLTTWTGRQCSAQHYATAWGHSAEKLICESEDSQERQIEMPIQAPCEVEHAVARAIVRRVIREAHRRGVEISVVAA